MNDPKGYYNILNLTDADCKLSQDEFNKLCKKNYRKLVIAYHPDKQQGKSEAEKKEAEEKFKKLAEAYDILTDENKRQRYDQFGSVDMNQSSFNPNDIFNQMFGGMGGNPFGSMFEQMFGGMGGHGGCQGCHGHHGNNNHKPFINGENIIQQITISLKDAYLGTIKNLTVKKYTVCSKCHGEGGTFNVCPHCNGSGMQVKQMGFMTIQTTCPACGGQGKARISVCSQCHGSMYTEETTTIKVNIPAGIDNGNTLRLAGNGKPGINGGQNGDLLVNIKILQDQKFIRKENDLYTVININYSDLLIGKELTLNVFDNSIKFSIPIGHHILDDIIINGKGFKNLQSNNYGNLHIALQIPSLNHKLDNNLYNQLVELEKKIFK